MPRRRRPGALVTGSSSGIGLAIATALAREGAAVTLNGRDGGRLASGSPATIYGFFTQGRPSSLVQRFLSPDEIANLVAYLASPLASATTGAVVRAEGGILHAVV